MEKDICLMLPCRDITRTIQARISAKKEQKKIDKAVQKAFQGLESANGDGMMMDGASADIGNKDMTMDNAAQNGATFSTEETVEAR